MPLGSNLESLSWKNPGNAAGTGELETSKPQGPVTALWYLDGDELQLHHGQGQALKGISWEKAWGCCAVQFCEARGLGCGTGVQELALENEQV